MTEPVIANPIPKPTIEAETQAALTGVKSVISTLEADEKSATGWVKTHTAWLYGFIGLLVGILIGHYLHK